MLVMSLEEYDEVSGKATKAAIMSRDVVGKTPPITQVKSAEEGLLVSLNQRGAVDLPFIGTLYGKPKAQIVAELGDLIFPDPESRTWQTADAYLSGNVRAKLAAAERAGPLYVRNANALRAVQPEDVLPGDTARIRRRHEACPASDQAIQQHAPSARAADVPTPPTRNSIARLPESYMERIENKPGDDGSPRPPM
jgi:N12 class adenine-specific DNA methylase